MAPEKLFTKKEINCEKFDILVTTEEIIQMFVN